MESGRPGWESWLQASCLPCLSKGPRILFLPGAAGLGGAAQETVKVTRGDVSKDANLPEAV